MSLASAILARRMRLARARTRALVCERDLRVVMQDGAALLADRWVARAARGRAGPTVLVRSPYGRRHVIGLIFPLIGLDRQATGAEVDWWREALANPGRDSRYWVARDYAAGVSEVAAPVQLVGGWYDIFLPWMLEDFDALRAAGRDAQLVVGPWAHISPA